MLKHMLDYEESRYILNDSVTPLYCASKSGHLDIVKYLIERGADVDAIADFDNHIWTPLHVASSNGHLDVVKYLIEKGAETTRNQEAPLCIAATNGQLEVVKYLFEIDPEKYIEAYEDETSPLHLASDSGHLEIVKYLIEKGFDVNSRADDIYYLMKKLLLFIAHLLTDILKLSNI